MFLYKQYFFIPFGDSSEAESRNDASVCVHLWASPNHCVAVAFTFDLLRHPSSLSFFLYVIVSLPQRCLLCLSHSRVVCQEERHLLVVLIMNKQFPPQGWMVNALRCVCVWGRVFCAKSQTLKIWIMGPSGKALCVFMCIFACLCSWIYCHFLCHTGFVCPSSSSIHSAQTTGTFLHQSLCLSFFSVIAFCPTSAAVRSGHRYNP